MNTIGSRQACVAFLAVLAMSCFAACSRTPEPQPPAAATATEPAPDVAAQDSAQWRFVEFRSMDDAQGTLAAQPDSAHGLRMSADGSATLRSACADIDGTWSATDGDAQSGQIAFPIQPAPRAGCQEDPFGQRLIAQAPYIRSYLRKDGMLYLNLMADGGTFALAPADGTVPQAAAAPGAIPVAAPEDGGPRAWTVSAAAGAELREAASMTATIVHKVETGALLANLGCQDAEGADWCDVQPLGGGPRGMVPASLLSPAVSPDGTVATGPDDSALRAGQGEFDAAGELPCALADAQAVCAYRVARAGGGYASVRIETAQGASRLIYYAMGKPIGSDANAEFSVERQDDTDIVRIGRERYEIPQAVALGG